MIRWAILTGEYPPRFGGVGDYTRVVARELAAAGDIVSVYTPPTASETRPIAADPGVVVNRLPGCFGPRSIAVLDAALSKQPRPDRVLLQYVPHAFGWKAMNFPFATWMAYRLPRLAPVWVMFHEVLFPFAWRPPKHALLGAATRWTARLVAGSADRAFVSIPAWGDILKRVCPRVPTPEWLPIPCTLDALPDLDEVARLKRHYTPHGEHLVGHFGTFGVMITDILMPTISRFLRESPRESLLLVGRGGVRFRERLAAAEPGIAKRVYAVGELSAPDAVNHLLACDLVVQPYPDGVTSRRTSVMAALAHGLPVVTNLGFLSESLWQDHVATVPAPNPVLLADSITRLLNNIEEREELGRRGLRLYREHFAVARSIARLRGYERE